jgi:hypothetical protein
MNIFDLRPLLSLGFWFNPIALPFVPLLGRFILGLMALSVVLGFACWAVSRYGVKDREQKHFLRRVSALSLWAGIVGFVLYGLNWQGVPILSMRIFWLVWLGAFGYWKYLIMRDYLVEMPKRKVAQAERSAYEKWLPKPKK